MSNQIALGQIFDDDRVFRHGCQIALKSGPRSFFPSCGTDALRTTGKKQSQPHLPTEPDGYRSLCPRSMHHRKPSITPTMGLSEYNNRHCSGTTLELNPTGDT